MEILLKFVTPAYILFFLQAERARKGAENELADANDRVNELSAQVSSFSGQKRKLEADINAMQTDLDEMNSELRAAEERAKKAMADAARLADELRQEQEHSLQVGAVFFLSLGRCLCMGL